MANLYWHAVGGQNGPGAGGLWGRGRAGVIWRNIAEAANDVRLEPITFDLLALFYFAHFPNLPQIKSVTRAGLRLMTEADIATLGIQNTHRSRREPPRGSVETHL
jgi:hypothetical protein